MSFSFSSNSPMAVVLALIVATFAGCAAQTELEQTKPSESTKLGHLGTVEFPTTCSPKAQPRFIRGLAALHSFWYPVALEEFRAATQMDPTCMMGYWGEVMAHNHPIWGDPQETEAARKVVGKIKITPDLTARERAYLDAVKVLVGKGDKPARDRAYAAAMEKIHRDYPEDAEAALLYALALMGTAPQDPETGLQTRMRAGEIASQVFKKKPDHPGAAHYVIHAYDDPKNAHLAVGAARRYAKIAPAALHALHMPSHIFLQLGMWPEATASNRASWAASDKWVKENDLPISRRDYHSLHWLQYAYLQQGRHDDAKALLDLMRQSLAEFPKQDQRNLMYGTYLESAMAADYLITTEQWSDAEKILGAPTWDRRESAGARANPYADLAAVAQVPRIFARGLAAAMIGSPEAHKSIAALQEIAGKKITTTVPFVGELQKAARIQALEISAAAHAAQGEFDEATGMMKRALKIVDAMPPPAGPPALVKPPHELSGEILLRANRPRDAAAQFTDSLLRHRNRSRSLLGAARAFAQAGETQLAAKFYGQFARQWREAEAQAPELREAQRASSSIGP